MPQSRGNVIPAILLFTLAKLTNSNTVKYPKCSEQHLYIPPGTTVNKIPHYFQGTYTTKSKSYQNYKIHINEDTVWHTDKNTGDILFAGKFGVETKFGTWTVYEKSQGLLCIIFKNSGYALMAEWNIKKSACYTKCLTNVDQEKVTSWITVFKKEYNVQ